MLPIFFFFEKTATGYLIHSREHSWIYSRQHDLYCTDIEEELRNDKQVTSYCLNLYPLTTINIILILPVMKIYLYLTTSTVVYGDKHLSCVSKSGSTDSKINTKIRTAFVKPRKNGVKPNSHSHSLVKPMLL